MKLFNIKYLNNIIEIIKKIKPYLIKSKKYVILYVLIQSAFIGLNLIIPIVSAKLILNITNGLLNKIIIIALVLFGLEFFKNIFMFLSRLIQQKFFVNLLSEIQKDMVQETLKIDISEMEKKSSGIFINRLTKDAENLSDFLLMLLHHLASIFTDIGVLLAIFILNKTMFVYWVIVLIVVYFVESKKIKMMYTKTEKLKKIEENNSGLIGEIVRGIRDIKVLNSSVEFVDKVMNKIENENRYYQQLMVSQDKYSLFSVLLKEFSSLLFIFIGVILIKNNNLSIDNMIVIYMYKAKIFSLLTNVSVFKEQINKIKLSYNRIFEIIDGKFKKEIFGNKHLEYIEGNFKFNNVTFGYEKDRPILKNLSFKVNANETVAFIGKSGSGKSTIFNLIDKIYTVQNGEILIDGININDLDKDSIRDNISIITQSPYIFNLSIKENLKVAKQNATDEEIIEVCKMAQIHDYIMTLPSQYETVVGEGGLTLSGGQRQRLAIARAMLKQTEIILFDEATSALDNETQNKIQEAINSLKGSYTILIIAHRLSTVINCDRLILIDDGQVKACGTHEELLKTNEIYKNLYENELK